MYGLLVIATMTAIAWWKALQFDPYSMSFFTKTYIAPSPSMPNELRMAGAVIIVLGALVGWATVRAVAKGRVAARDGWVAGVGATLVIAMGAAFFVAAHSAQVHIAQETGQ
jgi:hypothetical protein